MKPFYDAEGITLYQGDCREVVAGLGEFDLALADPPYAETELEWDVWPEGWPGVMACHAKQLWCFGSMRMFWDYHDEFAGWKLAQDLVWEKQNGSGLLNDRFRRVHETMLHFYRGPWGGIHKQKPVVTVQEERARTSFLRGRKPTHWGGEPGTNNGYSYNGERLMRSVLPVRNCHGYAVNETQKPEALVEPLLRYSVPPGGRVLVPFAGSGTDLVVARRLGLRAVGVEKRESQCREIVRRLGEELGI